MSPKGVESSSVTVRLGLWRALSRPRGLRTACLREIFSFQVRLVLGSSPPWSPVDRPDLPGLCRAGITKILTGVNTEIKNFVGISEKLF